MRNRMRARAKAHMPMVLLTLLSIIQALALELIWAHIREQPYLFEANWVALVAWVQVATTLAGVLLIWLLYSTMVMRFRWVPSTSDTVFPFLIGLIEFTLIATMGPDSLAWWFLTLAMLFAITHWAIQLIMVTARRDPENAAFFDAVAPATLRDFVPTIGICLLLAGFGLGLGFSGHQGLFALLGLLIAAAAIGFQLVMNAHYWRQSMAAEDDPQPS